MTLLGKCVLFFGKINITIFSNPIYKNVIFRNIQLKSNWNSAKPNSFIKFLRFRLFVFITKWTNYKIINLKLTDNCSVSQIRLQPEIFKTRAYINENISWSCASSSSRQQPVFSEIHRRFVGRGKKRNCEIIKYILRWNTNRKLWWPPIRPDSRTRNYPARAP